VLRTRRKPSKARFRAQSKAKQARDRANQIKVTQGGYLAAFEAMTGETYRVQYRDPHSWDDYEDNPTYRRQPLLHKRPKDSLWLDGTAMDPEHLRRLDRWLDENRLQSCGQTIAIQGCTKHKNHPAHTVTHCCNVPFCPRHQRRQSQLWTERAMELIDLIPEERGYSWKMVTIALKDEPDLQKDIDNHLQLRREMYRLMSLTTKRIPNNPFDARAMIGALEQAGTPEKPHIHLHLVIYCKHLPREMLQSWLRSRDCSVDGCDHPADTRGTDSKCNGSWYIDIRKLRCWRKAKFKKCGCSSSRKCQAAGVREALKYATKPVNTDKVSVPREGKEPTVNELAWAGQVLKFAAHMYKRHRVETYGDAKPMLTKIIRAENGDDSEEHRAGCRECGAPMKLEYIGWCKNIRDGYEWARPRDRNFLELQETITRYEVARANELEGWQRATAHRRAMKLKYEARAEAREVSSARRGSFSELGISLSA